MRSKARLQEEDPSISPPESLIENALDFVDAPELELISYLETQEEKPHYSHFAFRIVAAYAVAASLFAIVLSDTAILWLFGLNLSSVSWIFPLKIAVLLIASSGLLYYLISSRTRLIMDEQRVLEHALQRLQRLTQIHQVISQTNRVILRVHDKEQLIKDVCQTIKEYGHFSYVWIGICESQDSQPNMMVTSGKEDEYLRLLFEGLQSASATERGEPALSALRKKYAVIVNNVAGFSKSAFSWQTRALQFGFNAIGGFPFKTAAGMSGVVALYAKQIDYFSAEEITLLRALAADISYGLNDIEHKTQLYFAANYDMVTHLPNRQLYEDRLNQTILRALHDKRFAGVIIVEIVAFSKTVEAMGQAVGEKLLQETGNHLLRLVRDGDTVSRMSHTQLGIMLADVAEAFDVAVVSQKLIKSFGVHLSKQNEIQIHLRAGVAIFPQDGDTSVTLIKNATQALQEMNKESQNECAFFSKQMSSGLKYNQQLRQVLIGGLERNEFNLYYQPIVVMRNRQVIGVEALARWRNASLGDVSPVQFIAEAEETGFIIPLGEWVLRTACLQLQQWRLVGHEDLMMTINLSVKQLMHPSFLDSIKKIFKELSFDPKQCNLAFEIPETALVEQLKYTLEILLALRELGIKIIIDDFGTGYSSLSYLHQLPVDIIKIDPMFIRNLAKDKNTQALVRGILAFAVGLDIKTIAEGVETDKQVEMLTDLGCDYMQGYLYSAPVAAKNVESFFGKRF